MKPKTPEAMQRLIDEIRQVLPFDMPEAYLCDGVCKGCSLKLLDYLDSELAGWESRLYDGEVPCLADIQKLAKSSKKIYKVLEKNDLLG
ncbi:MAG: hypothetical protein DIZ80_12820 [endosymbiont of Galathealinum brachiosum]|uniref:Uncharacterized protein n=1 Tax=endosymbiont of Galathealinum brachiosum TaxID=2200906 RepID=A0A370DBL3_9GAMM|nr:MAG: hypothetical protein DIZ80_12820 [endosymbiont of Galathealinum brachiosum]